MSDFEALRKRIEGYGQQIIEAQRRLIAVPALGPANGGQGELAKAEVVQGWLTELGLKVERVDCPDPRVESGVRPNLVATLAGGDGPPVWVLAHLDVVPPGPADSWSSDPWSLRVEGDRLHGRGAEDNHHGLLASFFAVKALVESGVTPAGKVGLVMVADEETGSLLGLDYLLRARPDLMKPRDLIIVPDAGEPDASLIEVAEKSILWLKVEVTGRQVHASTPDKGVNALMAAARMMVAVRQVRDSFGLRDELFTNPGSTMEPTRHEAGVPNINTIPGQEIFYLDCRVLPTIPLDQVESAFRDGFQAIAVEEGVTVSISPVQKLQAPPATDPAAPVVTALRQAIERVHGVKARPGGIGGGTVAAFFRQRGLPVAVWSSAFHTAHMPDEWTSLSALIKDAQVFARLFAGQGRA
jgi:succinyl-diaminopimelate desuccinylase